jgi:hypothetical protein
MKLRVSLVYLLARVDTATTTISIASMLFDISTVEIAQLLRDMIGE